MTFAHSDFRIGCGLLGFCAFATWRTLRIPQVGTGTSAGPDFVPWLMIGMILVFALWMMGRAVLSGTPAAPSQADRDAAKASRNALIRIGIFVVLLVAYAACFMTLGYVATTLVVFVSGMLLLGERRPLVLTTVPVVITLAIYFGFTEILQVWLP